MMNRELLYQWKRCLSAHLPGLNSWQLANLALFSYGIIKAEVCQQGPVIHVNLNPNSLNLQC